MKTSGLTKCYKGKAAVNNVTMKIREGEIYGFIGRNGAGKSTTLKMISGLVHPDQGEIMLFGAPVTDEMARRRIGVLIESAGMYPNMTARENMVMMAKCLGLTDDKSIDVAMEMAGIADTGKKKTKQFSMGMKQRLGIAIALLGNPDLLILDEPINGLDPEGTRAVRQVLKRLNEEQGKTIIISSHILEELSKIATCYGIIKEGELIRQMNKTELEEECQDYLLVETNDVERGAALLSETFPGIAYKVYDRHSIRIYGYSDAGAVTTMLVQNGITVSACGLHRISLEKYFLNLMEGGASHV